MTSHLPHHLARSLVIRATPEIVFSFFTSDESWASWWGPGSTISSQPGGPLTIRYPNGTEVIGQVLEVSPPHRLVFTYGYASGQPVAQGASRVSIELAPHPEGTLLSLRHYFSDASVRDQHIPGWRFQLSLFANTVANAAFSHAADTVDRWFAVWAIADDAARLAAFASLACPHVRFRDRYSSLEGVDEISLHAGASQRFMPGVTLSRVGALRHCQGILLADWTASGPDGKALMSGSNVFVLDATGKIEAVTGFSA